MSDRDICQRITWVAAPCCLVTAHKGTPPLITSVQSGCAHLPLRTAAVYGVLGSDSRGRRAREPGLSSHHAVYTEPSKGVVVEVQISILLSGWEVGQGRREGTRERDRKQPSPNHCVWTDKLVSVICKRKSPDECIFMKLLWDLRFAYLEPKGVSPFSNWHCNKKAIIILLLLFQ